GQSLLLCVGEWNELTNLLGAAIRFATTELLLDQIPAREGSQRGLKIRQPDAADVVSIVVDLGHQRHVVLSCWLGRHLREVKDNIHVYGGRIELNRVQLRPSSIGRGRYCWETNLVRRH